MRVGRANPQILSSLKIMYCKNETLLGHISIINVIDNNVLIISPFDKSMLLEIDKAIRHKNLNLSSVIVRDGIKVTFLPLSLEDRKKLIKHMMSESEVSKISIRNIRRDIKNDLQVYLKNKNITFDEEKKAMKEVQRMTDKFILDVDNLVKNKEKELLTI